MPLEESVTDVQNLCVTLSRAHDVVVHAKLVLAMREPDVKKPYPRTQLVSQIQVLGLAKPKGPLRAARIMCSRDAQHCHWGAIRNVAHPGSVSNKLVHHASLIARP